MGFFKNTITDAFSIDGTWWLPSQKGTRLPGTLTFEPGQKLLLDLHGAFEAEFNPFSDVGQINPSIINGISIDGVEFTLLSCFRVNGKWNLSHGYSQVWYEPRFAVSGRCFDSVETMSILECSLGLNLLPQWIGERLPIASPKTLPNGQMGLTIVLETKTFFRTRITPIDTEISFVETFGTSKHSVPFQTVAYDRHSRLRIKPDENKSLDWYLDVVTHLRDAFFLLSGIPFDISFLSFSANNPNESEQEYVGGEEVRLNLFFVQDVIHDRSPIRPFDFPFSLLKVPHDELSRFFENWFDNKTQRKTVVKLLMESVRNRDGNWEIDLITITQGLETYHRTFRSGLYVDQKQYDDKILPILIGAIPSEVVGEHRSSLTSRLKYGNEYSLRTRIKSLLGELGEDVRSLLTEDSSRFVNKIIDTRNQLTHRSEELTNRVLTGADLFTACLRLRLLLLILLLKDMGFSEEFILNGIKDKNHIVGFSYSKVEYSSTET